MFSIDGATGHTASSCHICVNEPLWYSLKIFLKNVKNNTQTTTNNASTTQHAKE